jgi:Tol biopolymer transport system component
LTTEPGRDSNPAWSPDGRSIAFLRELPNGRAALATVPPLGGTPRKLAECYRPDLPFMNPSPAWSPDGKWLVIADKGSPQDPFELTLVSVDTGEKHRLTSSPAKTIGDSDAAFSPDGRWLAFVRTASFLSSDLYLLGLSADMKPKGDPRRVTFDSRVMAHPSWTRNGREVVFSSGSPGASSLWRIALSGRGPPRRLAYAGDEPTCPSIAPQAYRLAYSHSIFDPNIWRLPLDGPDGKAGSAESVLSSTRIDSHPVYSPDGKRIAFGSCRSGNNQIWVCDRDGSHAVQLTSFDGPIAALPRWSPDGERLVFDSNAAGQYDVYVVNVNGGQPQRLTDHPADDQAPNWSNDGRWIYFASHRSGEPQIWKMPATGGPPAQVTKGGGHFPSESPDGKFLYYAKKGGLSRSPVAGGEESQVLDSLHAQSFAVTGQGIYFIKGPAASASIYFLRFSTGEVKMVYSIPKPVFFGLSASPDGRSILYTQIDQQGSDLMLVENFR